MSKREAEPVSPSGQPPSSRPRLDTSAISDNKILAAGNYDDSKELLQTLLHHPNFVDLRQSLNHMCEKLRSELQTEDHGESDSQTHAFLNALHAVTDRLSNLEANVRPIVVALSGRMGHTGKSALVNSILSEPGLAKESGGALAGTRIVHVFKYKEADQKSRFRRQIKYFTNPQLGLQIKKHARTLFHWAHPNVNDAREEGDIDQDNDVETWDFQERTIKALRFFDHGLSKAQNRPFQNEDSARIFFAGATAEDDSKMLETLTEAVQNSVMLLPKMQSEHETVDDLKRESVVNASDIAWEVVDKIETCLEHPLLRHITLGDTAGNDDTDRDRVEKTVEYLRGADSILLIHTIMRVANDESVVNDIAWLRKNNLLKKATLVCTNLDQNLKLEEEGLTEDDTSKLEIARKERVAASKAAKKPGLQEEEKCELLAKKEFLTRCEKDARAIIRIRQTRSAMDAKLQQMTLVVQNLSSLPVFCISNKEYINHLKDPADEDEGDYEEPLLNVGSSGIPALRRHLYSIVESRILETVDFQVLSPLKRCVKDHIMHINRRQILRRADLINLIDALSPERKTLTDELDAQTRRGLHTAIIGKMTRHQAEFASQALAGFQSLHSQRVANYICLQSRRDGAPVAKRTDDWNRLVVEAFEDQVETGMAQMRKFAKDRNADYLKHSHEMVERTREELQKLLNSTKTSDVDFFESFEDHYKNFRKQANSLRKSLIDRDFTRIQQCLLDFKSEETSYVKSTMLPYYKEAGQIVAGRKDSRRRRVNIIELALSGSDGNVFDKVRQRAQGDFSNAIARWIAGVESAAERLWQGVKRDIKIRFIDDEDSVPSESSKETKELLEGVQCVLEGQIGTTFEECSKYVKQARSDNLA